MNGKESSHSAHAKGMNEIKQEARWSHTTSLILLRQLLGATEL